MVVLRIDVDPAVYEVLVDRGATERRPPNWQAEIELKRRFGLWPEFHGEPPDPEAADPDREPALATAK